MPDGAVVNSYGYRTHTVVAKQPFQVQFPQISSQIRAHRRVSIRHALCPRLGSNPWTQSNPSDPREKLSYDYISQITPGIGSQTALTNQYTTAPLSGLTQAHHPRFSRRSAAHTRARQVPASHRPSRIPAMNVFFIQAKRNFHEKTQP